MKYEPTSTVVDYDFGRTVKPVTPQELLARQIELCQDEVVELLAGVRERAGWIEKANKRVAALDETMKQARAAISLIEGRTPLEDWDIAKAAP